MNARIASVLAEAMRAPDPVEFLRRAADDASLDHALREALRNADADGVRIHALLVARLRFERLIAACSVAARDYERDPQAFAATFRAYHCEVPMTASFPAAEARLFRAWRDDATGARPRRGN